MFPERRDLTSRRKPGTSPGGREERRDLTSPGTSPGGCLSPHTTRSRAITTNLVMPGLDPGIHALVRRKAQSVPRRRMRGGMVRLFSRFDKNKNPSINSFI